MKQKQPTDYGMNLFSIMLAVAVVVIVAALIYGCAGGG
jgi:hypothetical protein